MHDQFRNPDPIIARMISEWPPLADSDLDRMADEIPRIGSTNQASRWLSQCRSILPADQTITSDYEVLVMLERAAVGSHHVGINGRRYLFEDGSSIVANGDGDRVYGP